MSNSSDPHRGTFDQAQSIASQVASDGDFVTYLIVIKRGKRTVELYHNKDAIEADQQGIEKDAVNIHGLDIIGVLDTSRSPGCKTVIINGRPYDKC